MKETRTNRDNNPKLHKCQYFNVAVKYLYKIEQLYYDITYVISWLKRYTAVSHVTIEIIYDLS